MRTERRRHPRIGLDVVVSVASGTNFYQGRARDVSTGGVFVAMPLAPEIGTELSLSLHVGSRRMLLTCRCAWVLFGDDGGPIGFGAEFAELGPTARRVIDAYLRTHDPMTFEMIEEVEPPGPPPLPTAPRPSS